MHFLPSYSPELNPGELVNADLKRSLPMHGRARDQAPLAAETRRFFHRRRRLPHVVRSYLGGPHVRYMHPRRVTGSSIGRASTVGKFIAPGPKTVLRNLVRRSIRRDGCSVSETAEGSYGHEGDRSGCVRVGGSPGPA
ncbi:hypothetical protein KWI83_17970 [Streptomyces sp. TRM70350]|nr:hypothetical protein [Streptomyces sp. TRM70350]